MLENLSIQLIFEIALQVSQDNGLPVVTKPEISHMFAGRKRHPLGIVKTNDAGTIWVDRYYIAYSLSKTNKFQYVYLSHIHVIEEYAGYRSASKMRKNPAIDIPYFVKREFDSRSNHDLWEQPFGCGMWIRKEYHALQRQREIMRLKHQFESAKRRKLVGPSFEEYSFNKITEERYL